MTEKIAINGLRQTGTPPVGVSELLAGETKHLLLRGECFGLMSAMPSGFVDCVVTSPPYWKMRDYEVGGARAEDVVGAEDSPDKYVENLAVIFGEVHRLLSDRGSLWLNLGDKYVGKNLMGMPWRVALAMQRRGWILRNAVIWDQMKGTQSVKDRMRDCYEHIFHFVKSAKYYFAADEIRIPPRGAPTVVNRQGRFRHRRQRRPLPGANQVVDVSHGPGKTRRRQVARRGPSTNARRGNCRLSG